MLESSPDSNRIAVCSWSLDPASPEELIESLRAVGILRVQLALSPIVYDPQHWGDAIPRLRDAGITIVSGMVQTKGEDYSSLEAIRRTGGVRPDAHWSANREHLETAARVAGDAGINLITLHAGFLPEDAHDPERSVMVQRLAELCELAAEHGVRLAFETGQETADALLDVLREIDMRTGASPGVNFDPANMILYDKGDPVAALGRLAPRVVQIHIKDARRTERAGTWGTEVAAGEGDVTWLQFIEVAQRAVPDVDLVIEREAGTHRRAEIRAARELVVQHLHASRQHA